MPEAPSNSLAITLHSKWTLPENRRREGLRAAHAFDVETLLDLLNHFLTLKSTRRSEVSPETRRLYGQSVRRFLEYAGPAAPGTGPRLALTQVKPEDIEAWLVQLHAAGLSANTRASYLYGLRALFRALEWAGVVRQNVAAEVAAPRDPTPAHAKKTALSPQLYRDLLALPSKTHLPGDPRAARDALLLALGGSAGLRANEICGLDVADLELGMKRLVVRAGKGGKQRIVPLTRSLLEACRAWLQVRQGLVLRGEIEGRDGPLLVALDRSALGRRLTTHGGRYIARGYYQALGLPPNLWGLHTLRRTAGTHLYRATRDLHVVADVLGHASVNTSAIYAKMDMEVRREALEAMESLRDEA